jgi:hypothetical protein
MISEQNLKYIPVNDLIDLMVISANELIVLHKKHDHENRMSKTQELQLIQKVIASKRVSMLIK